MDRRATFQLSGGLSLRRSRVMHDSRFEVAGFVPDALGQLKAMGLVSEIIAWRTRLFIPTNETGPEVLGRLLDRHPLVGPASAAV